MLQQERVLSISICISIILYCMIRYDINVTMLILFYIVYVYHIWHYTALWYIITSVLYRIIWYDMISILFYIVLPLRVAVWETAVRSISEISCFFWAETLAHWNPTSRQKNIHNQFARIRGSQVENSKTEIMETDRTRLTVDLFAVCRS